MFTSTGLSPTQLWDNIVMITIDGDHHRLGSTYACTILNSECRDINLAEIRLSQVISARFTSRH